MRWWRSCLVVLWLGALAGLMVGCAHKPSPRVTLAVAQTDRGVMIWLAEHLLFDFDQDTLSASAGPYLDRVADILRTQTTEHLLLEGHTDNIGAGSYNLQLSQRRADAVAQALQARGVAASRLKAVGVGMQQPLAPNDVAVGRRLNRRVELIVLNETVARLTKGQPANAFEDAFARLKAELEAVTASPLNLPATAAGPR
ncbi:OmpA family protein [Aquabacterium sp. A3]|uniref:OmpA family protein n=1 Tax=Aquabacterium sp. A3 TaxID=3132829 RepID=UPI003119537B